MGVAGGQWLIPVALGVLGITLARKVGPQMCERMVQNMEGKALTGPAAMCYRVHAALHRRMEREGREMAEAQDEY